MQNKTTKKDEKPANWHNPKDLFCHYQFTTGTCTQIETCQFKHSKPSTHIPSGMCPNGVKCPINHRKIKCPTEINGEKCTRTTTIGKKTFKCEYKHKKPESQKNQQKVQKQEEIKKELLKKEDEKIKQKLIEADTNNDKKKMESVQKEIKKQEIQKEDLKKTFKIFKIPMVSGTNQENTTICGVLDQSGSMSSCFPYLARNWNKIIHESQENNNSVKTVIFHDIAREEIGVIKERPDMGCTEIEAGFKELNKVLSRKGYVEDCVTIIFVSDGADNRSNSIEARMEYMRKDIEKIQGEGKKINFLCVGVGRGFPTFLAMKIRSLYHQGDSSVPPVFLIEDQYNENEFNNQFEIMKGHLQHKKNVTVNKGVRIMPWGTDTTDVKEGSFVLCQQEKETDKEEDLVVNSEVTVKEYKEFTLKDIIALGRTFLNDIQLKSLKKNQNQVILKEQANQAYDIISYLKQEYLDCNNKGKKLTFKERVDIRYNQETLVVILRNLKELSQSNVLSTLSEAEAAKRLAIGTSTGKYHERALKMAGLSVNDYTIARDEFIYNLEKQISSKSLKEETKQGTSFMSLMTQKDVFFEEGFIDALRQVPNQYDLVELFPLVGQSLMIRRTDGSMINPYLVSVKNIIRNHNTIDTVSLLEQKNEIQVSIGDDEIENMNAVIPLYTEEDKDLQFFLKSKLFSILMTFNVCQNVDTCLDQAYFALLCSCVVNLLNQKPSQWKEDMLDKVLYTIKLAYGGNTTFKNYQKMLIEQPRLAMVTEVNEQLCTKIWKIEYKDLKCEDLSKPLTHLLYLQKYGKEEVSQEKLQEIYDALFQEVIGRFIPRGDPLLDLFELKYQNQEEESQQQQQIYDEIVKKEEFDVEKLIERYYTKQNLQDEIEKAIEQSKIEAKEGSYLKIAQGFLRNGKFNMMSLKNILRYMFGEEKKLDFKNMVSHIVFGYNFKDSTERYLQFDKKYEQEKALMVVWEGKVKEMQEKIRKGLKEKLEQKLIFEYEQKMEEAHDFCLPLNVQSEEVQARIQEGLKVNESSLLAKNMCLYEKCPHYNKINKSLAQHMQSIVKIPTLHKVCREQAREENQGVSDEDVYKMILEQVFYKVEKKEGQNEEKSSNISKKNRIFLKENKELYLERIKTLREVYSNL